VTENTKQQIHEPTKEEKRRFERKPFSCPVIFEWTVQDDEPLGLIQCEGTVVNIHSSGFGLVTEQPINTGNVLKVYLPVEGAPISLPAFSEVRWSISNGNQVFAGLQYLT
jgi:hypothetical protein